jgi:hypothetical protein
VGCTYQAAVLGAYDVVDDAEDLAVVGGGARGVGLVADGVAGVVLVGLGGGRYVAEAGDEVSGP